MKNPVGRAGLALAVTAALLVPAAVVAAEAEEEKAPVRILFTNVNVFDGFGESLQEGMSVLVEGNLISTALPSTTRPCRCWLKREPTSRPR